MLFTPLPLAGAYRIDLEKREDSRGFFARWFCEAEFRQQGLEIHWLQMNTSFTKTKGAIRGLHFQYPPHAEVKVVKCIRGIVLDVIVDLRAGSPTYGQWTAHELSECNRSMLYIPQGLAHGFQTLSENVELLYLHSQRYCPESEGGVNVRCSQLQISWPLELQEWSDRDANLPELKDVEPIQVAVTA